MTIISTSDLQDLKSDIDTIDEVVESSQSTTTSKLGTTIRTLSGLAESIGYDVSLGVFAVGKTIEYSNQVLSYDGGLYRPDENLPYTTDGATPDADSGTWLVVSDGVLSGIARSLNVLESEVIYATDTTTVLDNVPYIYDASTQTTWGVPALDSAGKTIVSVVGSALTTTGGTGGNSYTLVQINTGRKSLTNPEILAGTPAIGELWFNTTDNTIHMGDGVTRGGIKQVGGVNSVKRFGAVGDGVVSDINAVKNAAAFCIENSLPLYVPPGVYNLEGWTTVNLSEGDDLVIVADDSLTTTFTGSGFDQEILFSITDDTSLSIEGVGFKSIRSVVYDIVPAGITQHVREIKIKDCRFSDMGNPFTYRTYSATSSDVTAKNVSVVNNIIENCGYGFSISTNIKGYNITGNIFRNLGIPRNLTPDVVGLSIGRDTSVESETTSEQGLGSISNNSFFNLQNNSPASRGGVTNFIQVFGRNISITGNSGEDLINTNSDATDQEGIYFKGYHISVSDNNLYNAGNDEGAIKGKGLSTPSLEPKDNTIIGNTISWDEDYNLGSFRRVAIATINGNVVIANNYVTNASTQGIVSAGGDRALVTGNVIKSIKSLGSTSINAILISQCAKSIVSDNIIEIDGEESGNFYGVVLSNPDSPTSDLMDSVSVRGNSFFLVNEAASPTGSIRCVRVDTTAFDIGNFIVSDNYFNILNANRLVIGISTTLNGPAPIRVVAIQNNTFDCTSTDSVSDINLSPAGGITTLGYDNNTGFTTVLP